MLSNIWEHARWDKGDEADDEVKVAIDTMVEIVEILEGVIPAEPDDSRTPAERALEAWEVAYERCLTRNSNK